MAERPGIGVDARGGAVVDPTANVIALVEANAKSADMLRQADIKFNDTEIAHVKEIALLRALNAETTRIGDLDRLASTRQVDVLAAASQAAAIATAVQTLSKQTSDLAVTLAAQTDSKLRDVDARIGELQKSSYQGGGKTEGMDSLWKLLLGIAGLLLGFMAYQSRQAAPVQAPQVIVLPAGTLTLPTAPQGPR